MNLVKFSINNPKLITIIMVLMSILFAFLIPLIKVDTDPENMLSQNEAVRIFHNKIKKQFALHDMVVLGIVNEKNKHGVFNPGTLEKVYKITQFVLKYTWQDKSEKKNIHKQETDKLKEEKIEKYKGVIGDDVMAPSTLDNVEPGGPGVVKFEWLMPKPPKTQEEALKIKEKLISNPIFKDTLVSNDGQALCLYIPITSKDISYSLYQALNKMLVTLKGDEQFYITGLPVAEDTFGVEMFIQMAISAPVAMLLIFLLMLFFFRKLVLILSPLILAMVSVICTMGLLIGTGYTVHIMSSMIPIFIMPIAVLDSIHVLSEFFDKYQKTKDRKKTIEAVMSELFTPMLYTSLTSAAGFISLALTPIPPVQVFGVFVAFGIMLAWILTITFIPAYTMLISEKSFVNFGATDEKHEEPTILAKNLVKLGNFSYKKRKLIVVIAFLLVIIAIYGINLININDNPVKWFRKDHPIRIADKVLNKHFAGTYMAYLNISPKNKIKDMKTLAKQLKQEINKLKIKKSSIKNNAISLIDKNIAQGITIKEFMKKITDEFWGKADFGAIDESPVWEDIASKVELFYLKNTQVFKNPDVLRYIIKLQTELKQSKLIGKINAVTDLICKINKELHNGDIKYYKIPDTISGVGQCLISLQNSHNPDDLWHLVKTDYTQASIWFQLKSGDNRDMEKVIREVDEFFKRNKAPIPLEFKWSGLTYINVVWQNKMVSGMLQAFMGSFLVVFIMMSILFRSTLWGILCMIPLTITIAFIYGVIGLIGKDYDMPVAVLSSLTLGLAVDFAIHYLARARALVAETGSWEKSIPIIYGEPARAISRNIIVIAVGFLPLLLAPLIPYQTVGIFLASILFIAGIATLYILPALMTILQKKLFKEGIIERISCNPFSCLIVLISSVLLIIINIHQYTKISFSVLFLISVIAIPVTALICRFSAKRSVCRIK